MVHKLLVTVFNHIKNLDSVSNVSISCNSLMASVNQDDVHRLVCLGHVLGMTVVCSPSYSSNNLIVSFYL